MTLNHALPAGAALRITGTPALVCRGPLPTNVTSLTGALVGASLTVICSDGAVTVSGLPALAAGATLGLRVNNAPVLPTAASVVLTVGTLDTTSSTTLTDSSNSQSFALTPLPTTAPTNSASSVSLSTSMVVTLLALLLSVVWA
jgi:hypothetical protein